MKIAVVAPTQIPARRANTIQVMKMTQALVKLGHQVRLAAPNGSENSALNLTGNHEIENRYSWQQLAHFYGLEYRFEIDFLKAQTHLRRYDYGWRALRWAKEWGADLLYTRLPQAAAFSSLSGMSTILEIHDLPKGNFGILLFRIFLKGKGAKKLVVITKALDQDIRENHPIPKSSPETIIAPDGVDIARYINLPSARMARNMLVEKYQSKLKGHSLMVERFTVGYTGHMYPGRGTNLLLKVAAYIPDITFLLVGGEPHHMNKIEERINNEHLDNVILVGFVANAELPIFQAACDLLLMPYQKQVAASSGGDISRYLSPMKLFEYMACGRAILSSDLPVFREILNESNAMLLPTESARTWADTILELQSNQEIANKLAKQANQDAQQYEWGTRAAMIFDEI